jgi:D-xylose 1-dehydrogenase (NADP+, D-xylono-1,5-lactone-forming)
MTKVRWGLLSTANINQALIPPIRASQRGELAAVASRSLDKAQAYAQEWEIPKAFGGYQEMLDSGEVDAVYIGLPNHLHAEWSIKAMQAGVHVLCEKPFAPTLEEVDAMIAAKEETGIALAEAFMYRHHPQTKIVGEWVHAGKLGEITVLRGAFNFRMPEEQRQPDNLNVRLVPEWGGGSLWDVGVYPLSYAQFIMGASPDWVFGHQWNGETDVDEVFSAQMGYALEHGTAYAHFTCSFRTAFHTFIEIIGTEGRLFVTRPFVDMEEARKLTFYPNEGQAEEIPVPEKELYLGEVEDMHAAILDGEPNFLRLDETRKHIQTVLALYDSARKGVMVTMQ